MNTGIKTLIVPGLMLVLIGCGIENVETWQESRESEKNIRRTSESEKVSVEIVGKIIFKDFEGGFFAIAGNDGGEYDPLNLPDDFKEDGLSVKVLAVKKPGVMTSHMYGTVIELLKISKL